MKNENKKLREIAKEAINEINELNLWYPSGAGKNARMCEMYNEIKMNINVQYNVSELAEKTCGKYIDNGELLGESKEEDERIWKYFFDYIVKNL